MSGDKIASVPGLPGPLRARFNCAGVGKIGMIRHVIVRVSVPGALGAAFQFPELRFAHQNAHVRGRPGTEASDKTLYLQK